MKIVVQQVMEAMKEKDDYDIFGVNKNSESDLSNEDDPTYVVPALETCYLDTETVIGLL